ncbi:MAG: hypothetical protein AAF990_16610 [Bacteroidota bacterium]
MNFDCFIIQEYKEFYQKGIIFNGRPRYSFERTDWPAERFEEGPPDRLSDNVLRSYESCTR